MLLEPTRILSGIQFTKHFIEFVVVETKQFVSSNPNVILTRQICGQRLSMTAGSKRRALAFRFSIRICYMFLISTCRAESDLGLYTTSALAKRMPLRNGHFCVQNEFGRNISCKSPLRSCILFASTEVVHSPRSDFPLQFDMKEHMAHSHRRIN